MDRVQRVLGYIGVVFLLAGVAVTAVGPVQFGLADDGESGADAVTEADAPVAAVSVPDSGGASDGTVSASNADDGGNATGPTVDDRTEPADGSDEEDDGDGDDGDAEGE